MTLPDTAEWERIHHWVETLDPLPEPERRNRISDLAQTGEAPLVLSFLRANFFVPNPVFELAPGAVVAGKYTVDRKIGEGGMGIVYCARQHLTDRDVALKVIHPSIAGGEGRTRFAREIAALGRLSHPSLPRIFDADVHRPADGGPEQLFFAMELVAGHSLDVWIRESRPSLGMRLNVMACVCDAVEVAHRAGMTHRDLKPQNIMVDQEGRAVVLDFGLTEALDAAASEASGVWLTEGADGDEAGATTPFSGTPAYMAPEQFKPDMGDGRGVGAGADIFALGVIVYEAIAGRLPARHSAGASFLEARRSASAPLIPLRAAACHVEPALEASVMKALRRHPAERYLSAGAFARQLRHEAARPDRLRRRARVAGVSAMVAAAALAMAALAWHERSNAEARRAEAAAAAAEAASASAETDGLVDYLLRDLKEKLAGTGRLDLMDSVMERAQRHYAAKVEATPQSAENVLLLSRVLRIRAEALASFGRHDDARSLYREAAGAARTARALDPGNAGAMIEEMRARLDTGRHEMTAVNYSAAAPIFESVVTDAEELAARHPGNPAMLRVLAEAHRDLASAFGHTDWLDGARSHYLRSRDVLAKTAALDPADPGIAYALAELDASLGSIEETEGNFPAMVDHFRAYHDFVQAHFGKESSTYSHSAFRMGVAMVKTGQPRDAIAYLSDAAAIAEREAERTPGHRGALNHLAWCFRYLAQAYAEVGDTGAASNYYRRESAVLSAFEGE